MKPTETPKVMTLTSQSFNPGQTLRRTYTADGADVSPALQWQLESADTKSFAIILRDVDAPGGTFIHWLVYNIPGFASGVPEGLPRQEKLSDGSIQGMNDYHVTGYNGPKPPPGTTHKYHFELYALDAMLPVEVGVTAPRLLELMNGHIIATAKLMGTYRR